MVVLIVKDIKSNYSLRLRDQLHGLGIYITNGKTSGCFLPQVATETGWNEEDFLSFCCDHKAGLAPDAWKTDPDVEVYLFTAEVFGDQWNNIQ